MTPVEGGTIEIFKSAVGLGKKNLLVAGALGVAAVGAAVCYMGSYQDILVLLILIEKCLLLSPYSHKVASTAAVPNPLLKVQLLPLACS